jgi:hypothetical protein
VGRSGNPINGCRCRATLNGVVNFADLVNLAQHYGQPGDWSQGDFTYDGVVNFADLIKLAQNYNAALPSSPIAGAPSEFQADLARAAAAAVPEPAGLSIVALAGVALMTSPRRRRRRDIRSFSI